MRLYRLKRKNSIYYVKWLDETKFNVNQVYISPILTDIKDEALLFTRKQAKSIRKIIIGDFVLERWKK